MELAGLEAVLGRTKIPVILIGNSLGGWLAMLYAFHHPEQVARVVLVNGGPLRGGRPDLTLTAATREEARKTVEALRDRGSPKVPDFVLDDIVRQAHNGPLGRLATSGKDTEQYSMEGKLNEFKVPIDLLWGGSDRLMSLSYAQNMERQLPAARLSVLTACGHVPQRECPDRFQAALEAVLGRSAP